MPPNSTPGSAPDYGHTMRKQGSCLQKQIMQGTMPGASRRGRLRTAWMDNIKTWTELTVVESVRMTEDRDKWRKYVHGVAIYFRCLTYHAKRLRHLATLPRVPSCSRFATIHSCTLQTDYDYDDNRQHFHYDSRSCIARFG